VGLSLDKLKPRIQTNKLVCIDLSGDEFKTGKESIISK
jgi:hypothetical protein